MRQQQTLDSTARLRKVVAFYMSGPKYLALKGKTQISYEAHLNKACATRISDGRVLGNLSVGEIRVKHLSDCYEKWLLTGVRSANLRMACLSACWKYARQKDIVESDPISLVDRVPEQPRKVMWERSHVRDFLDVAYSDIKYRSIGLIVHMAYEWAQRVGDMRLLTWDRLDLDSQRLDLTQSKRNADVHLPISDGLCRMLQNQKIDFGFQEFVAPKPKPRAGAFVPYDDVEISTIINAVKDKANVPSGLTAMDLRRTAVTEMLEGGVDMAGIMQVTGHRNPQSVKPYMVNTYRGASAALSKRGNVDEH